MQRATSLIKRTVVSGVEVLRGEGERVESFVAEDGEGFHTIDARAGFRVDIVGSEVIGDV
jgi:hypothetical protein